MTHHFAEFKKKPLKDLTLKTLQAFLGRTLLRYLLRNPALLLFTPRECPRPATRIMTIEEVRIFLGVLDIANSVSAAGAGRRLWLRPLPGSVSAAPRLKAK